MNIAVAKTESREIARPLHVLVPLIKDDIKHGDEAGMEFYIAAGEKLTEAREGSFSDQPANKFWEWATRNFGRSKNILIDYMKMSQARDTKSFKKIKSISGFRRSLGQTARESGRVFRPYQQPVDDIVTRAQVNAARLANEDLNRAEEREAQRKLALQLIDIGYKALASKLHPDKGGSRDAMARLNTVRDRLKANA